MSGSASTVARNRQPTPRWLRLLIASALIGLSVTFLTWMLWGWISYWVWGTNNDLVQVGSAQRDFSMGVPLPTSVPAPIQTTAPVAVVPVAVATAVAPVPAPPDVSPRMRPMIVWHASNTTPTMPVAKKEAADDDDDLGGTGTSKDSGYAKDMTATKVSDDRPALRRFPPRYTIRKGQLIDCTPPMPIDTQLPGPLWCDVDKDVYSMDGTMILIPAHSNINGSIEHGLGLGQDRAVIVFSDVLTAGPDFLEIPLGSSLGASNLGQNGVPVDVQAHTWEKIKTTLMFAGIDGISSALTASLQKGGNSQYNFGSVSGTGQSLAQIALQHDINIPTTGYRGPGFPLKVYVNHYIDLSKFYSTTLTRSRASE